jgi:hypothetical protein
MLTEVRMTEDRTQSFMPAEYARVSRLSSYRSLLLRSRPYARAYAAGSVWRVLVL